MQTANCHNPHKNTVFSALILALTLFVLLPASFVYLADPCHIFHKPLPGIFHHGFSYNQRCQNAGLINQYLQDEAEQFQAFLLGTSLSGNFLAADIARAYGLQRAMKLFLPDGRPSELQATAEKALLDNTPKLFIWEVLPQQFMRYSHENMESLRDSAIFPAYLYNRSQLDDYRYIFNSTTLAEAINVLQQSDIVNIPSIDMMGLWDHGCPSARDCKPFHTAEDIDNIRKDYIVPAHRLLDDAGVAALDYSNVDDRLLGTVLPHCNTDMRIDLFFPPLSYLWFASQDSLGFHHHLYMLRHLVNKTASCSNIRVFAFNDEDWIAGDLAHYHDPRHFFGDVQRYIIESMAAGRHRITAANVQDYEWRVVDAVNHYIPRASSREQMQHSARY